MFEKCALQISILSYADPISINLSKTFGIIASQFYLYRFTKNNKIVFL